MERSAHVSCASEDREEADLERVSSTTLSSSSQSPGVDRLHQVSAYERSSLDHYNGASGQETRRAGGQVSVTTGQGPASKHTGDKTPYCRFHVPHIHRRLHVDNTGNARGLDTAETRCVIDSSFALRHDACYLGIPTYTGRGSKAPDMTS